MDETVEKVEVLEQTNEEKKQKEEMMKQESEKIQDYL